MWQVELTLCAAFTFPDKSRTYFFWTNSGWSNEEVLILTSRLSPFSKQLSSHAFLLVLPPVTIMLVYYYPHTVSSSHDSQIVYWFVYSLACIDVFFCFGLFSVNSHEMQIREVFSCHGLYAGLSSSIPFK